MGAEADIRNAEVAGRVSAPLSDISMVSALSRKRTLDAYSIDIMISSHVLSKDTQTKSLRFQHA